MKPYENKPDINQTKEIDGENMRRVEESELTKWLPDGRGLYKREGNCVGCFLVAGEGSRKIYRKNGIQESCRAASCRVGTELPIRSFISTRMARVESELV